MQRDNTKTSRAGLNFRHSLNKSQITQAALADTLKMSTGGIHHWTKFGVPRFKAKSVAALLNADFRKISSKRAPKKAVPAAAIAEPMATALVQQLKTKHTPRSINLELLELIAEKRLSKTQETIILSVANNFLQEQAA
jgi:hypothetical protein|tara:strand:- start:233 stop:646 length:414 start_codon:yes stop_codon:yes gene_type:complete